MTDNLALKAEANPQQKSRVGKFVILGASIASACVLLANAIGVT